MALPCGISCTMYFELIVFPPQSHDLGYLASLKVSHSRTDLEAIGCVHAIRISALVELGG